MRSFSDDSLEEIFSFINIYNKSEENWIISEPKI